MFKYDRKLKIMLSLAIFVVVLALYCCYCFGMTSCSKLSVLPNDGRIELIDGNNIIIEDDNFSLDLDTFNSVGETQTCTFVFKNNNSASAHVFVTLTCNEKYLKMDGMETFEIKPNETYEYRVDIKLTEYPTNGESLPININFNTSYY